ncbi:MAG: antibiotic biosynthesis monooxygenase [Acidimicrobiia bacterium]|nr:antibiotic biosynthesis monooxygenase [Acidimicrobiia bacterium]
MSVVRINAISVPEGAGPELERRFAQRLGAVDEQPGFEGFELLRPTGEAEDRYFVVTHWESEETFQAWVASRDFTRGHAGPSEEAPRAPVSTDSQLLEFDVVFSTLRPEPEA